jgi:UrcA family protein
MRIRTASMFAASSFALMLAGVSPAAAQQNCGTYGGYDPKIPTENVIVSAPHMTIDHGRLNGPIGRVSVSVRVSYADLDLCTQSGDDALKARIREAARDVCGKIDEQYPVSIMSDRPCFRGAVADAVQQANLRISEARGWR